MSSSTKLMAGLVAIAALALGVYLSQYRTGMLQQQRDVAASDIRATVLQGSKPLAAFTLTDQRGQPFTESSLRGRWSFLFFGYTYCPDVCPMTLLTFSRMAGMLPSVAAPYQVVFVSIDPERDTPARLADYVSYFNPAFLGVTGSDAELTNLTRQLGILYFKAESKEDGAGYLMDHSASVILVDPEGRFHALFSAPHDPREIAEDFAKIAG